MFIIAIWRWVLAQICTCGDSSDLACIYNKSNDLEKVHKVIDGNASEGSWFLGIVPKRKEVLEIYIDF